jgi:Xaa-Pro aminopeptidase
MKFCEFQKILNSQSLDLAVFFGHDANLTYFAGVKPDSGCLVVPAVGKPVLFVPGFDAERIAKHSAVKVVQAGRDFLNEISREFPAGRIGIVPSNISYAQAHGVQTAWNAGLVNIGGVCTKLRSVKTEDEVARIAKACAITDCLFDGLCSNFDSFKTEQEVASFLKLQMSLLGLEPSFPPIVASGKNASLPHHVPDNSKLSGYVVLDFGVIYRNYCSDITRTVFAGNPSASQKRTYDVLLDAQEKCIKKVLPGVVFEEINDFARKSVGKRMIHSVGHSLGVEVHDVQPRPWRLQAGNVLTVEPGTYTKNKFGIRIEDDIFVSKKGPVLLTHSDKSLVAFR